MTEPHEITASKHPRLERLVARAAVRIAAGLICFIAVAGLGASDVSAQNAPAAPPAPAATPAAAPAAPKLTSEMCLGCHGQEGFAPATKPEAGTPPPVLKDRFLGSVHGKRQCVECHTNVTKIPHGKVEVKVSCVSCHQNLLEEAKDNNKPELVAKAKEIFDGVRRHCTVAWDDRGNIGKRYLAQDEIGTPMCVTVDFQTLEDDTVTIRDRDTKAQERVPASDVVKIIGQSLGR